MESTLLGNRVKFEQEQALIDVRKNRVVELLNSIESGDSAAVEYIDAEKFRQHNLTAEDGVAGFAKMMEELSAYHEPASVNVCRVLCDGDYVVAHSQYNLFGKKVGFDIFRFEGDKIIEHWDNLQADSGEANASGNTMTDGVTRIFHTDNRTTRHNKSLIEHFATDILIRGNINNLGQYFEGDNYLQHNPNIANGVSALRRAMEQMAKQGIAMQFEYIHAILGEGDFVLLVTEGRYGKDEGAPTAYYDLFRVENGKIAEHWDVIEQIIDTPDRKNSNGKFGFKNLSY